MNLFIECRTQVLASFGGVIGIDRIAVRMIGEDFGIRFDREWWQLFGIVESTWLECIREHKSDTSGGAK